MRNKILLRSTALALCAVSAAYSSSSMAQTVPTAQTGSASAGRAVQQIQVPDQSSINLSPRIEVKELKIQDAPAGAEKVSFVLKDLQLEGVTVYSGKELQKVYGSGERRLC